jgi:outer membrane cobalamin receptor
LRAGWRRPGLAIGAHAALLAIDYEEPDLLRLDASTTRFWSGGADAAWETLVFDRHLIAARAEAAGEASRSTEHGDLFRARGAIALSGEGDFDPWIAFAAMRLQIVTDFGLEVLPRAGVRFEATPDLSFVLAAGRSMRVPALDELHHPSEPGLEGNPALAPETAWEVDLSADVTFGESSASASVFARTIEDAILYVHRNAFVIRPENLGAARAVGGEIESQLAFELAGARVDTELCASLFLGELSVTRVPLPGQPAGALEGSLAVAPRIGAERPLELFTRVRWSSPTSTNVHGTLDVNAYTRWDAGLTYRVASQWAASILVTNVLDDRTLETVLKIPLPGRMVLASIRVTTPEEETEAAEP